MLIIIFWGDYDVEGRVCSRCTSNLNSCSLGTWFYQTYIITVLST